MPIKKKPPLAHFDVQQDGRRDPGRSDIIHPHEATSFTLESEKAMRRPSRPETAGAVPITPDVSKSRGDAYHRRNQRRLDLDTITGDKTKLSTSLPSIFPRQPLVLPEEKPRPEASLPVEADEGDSQDAPAQPIILGPPSSERPPSGRPQHLLMEDVKVQHPATVVLEREPHSPAESAASPTPLVVSEPSREEAKPPLAPPEDLPPPRIVDPELVAYDSEDENDESILSIVVEYEDGADYPVVKTSAPVTTSCDYSISSFSMSTNAVSHSFEATDAPPVKPMIKKIPAGMRGKGRLVVRHANGSTVIGKRNGAQVPVNLRCVVSSSKAPPSGRSRTNSRAPSTLSMPTLTVFPLGPSTPTEVSPGVSQTLDAMASSTTVDARNSLSLSFTHEGVSSDDRKSYVEAVAGDNNIQYSIFNYWIGLPSYKELLANILAFVKEGQGEEETTPTSSSKPSNGELSMLNPEQLSIAQGVKYKKFMEKCMNQLEEVRVKNFITVENKGGAGLTEEECLLWRHREDRTGLLGTIRSAVSPSPFSSGQAAGSAKWPSTTWWTQEILISEGIERYVTWRLHKKCLYRVLESDRSTSRALTKRLDGLKHRLTPADLGVNYPAVESHHLWGQAMFELNAMQFFKSPREKLGCGIRAVRFMCEALKEVSGLHVTSPRNVASTKRSVTTACSEEAQLVIRCLALLVLRAAPTHFYDNVKYIQRFRTESLCTVDEQYALGALGEVVKYWLECDDTGKKPREANPLLGPGAGCTDAERDGKGTGVPKGAAALTSIEEVAAHRKMKASKEGMPGERSAVAASGSPMLPIQGKLSEKKPLPSLAPEKAKEKKVLETA